MSRGWPWVLAGLLSAGLGLGGLASFSRAEPARRADWRPACVNALPDLEAADARIVSDPDPAGDPAGVLLLGLDVSRSNARAVQDQLAEARRLLERTPLAMDVGVLLVAEHSDASGVPDLWSSGTPAPRVEVDPVCVGACTPRSLFEQRCQKEVQTALESRRRSLASEVDAVVTSAHGRRIADLGTWADHLEDEELATGTSLVRFWRKIVDLPAVRDGGRPVSVVLLSDLIETERGHRRFINRVEPAGACPPSSPLPDLSGVRVVLLQTVGKSDPQAVGERWEAALRCAGARVERFRWTPALGLDAYLPEIELAPDQPASTGSKYNAATAAKPTAQTAVAR